MFGRALVWLFTEAISVEVDGVRYIPDWNAIGAVAGAVAAAIGLLAIWYSICALRRQLRHQSELEMKQLEQELLIKIMNLADVPYNGSHEALADLVLWRESGGPAKNPGFLVEAGRRALQAHRSFSTATATALAVLRRSRRRRFSPGTKDLALEKYDELVQMAHTANGKLLEYAAGDFTKFDLGAFQTSVGSNAFDAANLLRRITGELLARLYADDPEWLPFEFVRRSDVEGMDGRIAMDFADQAAEVSARQLSGPAG